MKESDFSKKFVNGYLREKFPYSWGIKIHGHEMQSSSVPDQIFCINGIFTAIEFKVRRDSRISITPGQIKELNKIKNANGIGLIIAYDEDKDKIMLREKRIDYKSIFFSPLNTKKIKSKNIYIDFDFEFSTYEDAVALIGVMVENKTGLIENPPLSETH